MTTTLVLSIAMAVLLIFTIYKRFICSPHKTIMLLFHLLIVIVLLLYRINTKHTKQAPLFSFPSLSQPLVSLPSISLSQPLFSFPSLSKPLLSIPSLSLKTIIDAPLRRKKGFALPDPVVPTAPPEPDVVILDNVSYQERIINVDMGVPVEQGDMSIDDTWNAILASGGAKPVSKLKKSEKRERFFETNVIPKAKVNNSVMGMKKKKKKPVEMMEERVEGWRNREALVTPHDDLSRRFDAFIKKQKDYLKLQREESDQRRLLERPYSSRNTFLSSRS